MNRNSDNNRHHKDGIDRIFPSRIKNRKDRDILKETASSQIEEYQQRLSRVVGFYDSLFKDLIVDNCNSEDACNTAKKFFDKDKDTVNFVAIDGTEYSKSLFDMIIFFAGAYSCEGTINFSNGKAEQGNIEVKYQNRFMDQGKDISSCVPVYIDKVPDIDQTFHDTAQGQGGVI
jgi:hypothetical protein